MFVPDHLLTEEDSLPEANGQTCDNEHQTSQINGDHKSGDNNDTSSNENDAIELTHDETTGVTAVALDQEDDGMNQCAMWNTASPKQEEEDYSNTVTYTDANNVLNSFGGGDIWSTEGFTFESPLKDLLDSNIYSLVDLLEQDELLQELRGCEARLIDYFSKPEAVAGLVECMICEVPYADDIKGKERWCREEKERRAKVEQVQFEEKTNGGSLNESRDDERRSPEATILDTTNEIEASWNSPLKNPSFVSSKNEATANNQRTPEEEYDLKYCRYPYMACEVLCSDIGETLNVLINGSVQDITIDDDDDSLLNENTGVGILEAKYQDEEYDSINVFLDEPDSQTEQHVQRSQQIDPPHTPRNQAPSTRILDLLFSVLIDTPPSSLDDRRAGYFEKILVILFRKYPQTMSDYMNNPIIETAKSKEISQSVFSNKFARINRADDSAYVSLMPSMDGNQNSPANLRPALSAINTRLPIPDVSSIQTPPMLMCALFDHLHSHSIMHIIQRLLLPSAARKAREAKNESDTGAENGSPNSAMNDKFMNHINQMNSDQDQNRNSTDDEDVEDDIDNPMNHLFQCDWSDRPIHALDLLLSRLEGHTEQPYLIKYKYPVGYDESLLEQNKDCIDTCNDSDLFEVKLSYAQHASEILIGIIQNSPLESSVMVALTSEPFLSRIIKLTCLSSGLGSQALVPYESVMTCAMTVLENLILQLGGYGAASAKTAPASDFNSAQQPRSPPPIMDTDTSFSLTELGPHTPAASPAHFEASSSIATSAALVNHLPSLLEELSSILVHPETKKWITPTQYNCQPRPILGTVRIRIVRIVESLVFLGDRVADLILQQSDCLECCLDLFWEFEWCSMLHQSVANFLVHVFEAGDHRAGLQDYFVVRCQLLEKLMDSFIGDTSSVYQLNKGQEIKANAANSGFVDDVAIAMKTMYTNPATSSVESLDGSDSDNNSRERLVDDDNDPIAHVSEDDVESAMEKEEQDNQAFESNAASEAEVVEKSIGSGRAHAASKAQKLSFRHGYMGHVIIICQALANACNSIPKESRQNDSCDEPNRSVEAVMLTSSLTGDFESSAVHLLSGETGMCSNRRLDTSPTRSCDEDLPMSPIETTPTSPNEIEALAQSPLESPPNQNLKDMSHLAFIVSHNAVADKWSSFVSTTLAAEISLQSAPLGGQQAPKDSAASVDSDSKNNRFISAINDEDNEFFGDKGVFGIIDGDIDMNEAEIDIAAEMIESLSLNSTNEDPQPIGHNRVGGGILSGSESSANSQERNIGNFGSLIQSNYTIKTKGYVYDDPLGTVCQFEKDDSSDEEDIDFAPKSANFEENGTAGIYRSSSTDEDDEDMAPVLDLFTGNFADNFTNDNDNCDGSNSNGDDVGWANFANFDDAFAVDDSAASS
jgi:hypothetical protein